MNDISKDDNDQVNEAKADEPRHETKETPTPLQSHQDPRDQIIKEQAKRILILKNRLKLARHALCNRNQRLDEAQEWQRRAKVLYMAATKWKKHAVLKHENILRVQIEREYLERKLKLITERLIRAKRTINQEVEDERRKTVSGTARNAIVKESVKLEDDARC